MVSYRDPTSQQAPKQLIASFSSWRHLNPLSPVFLAQFGLHPPTSLRPRVLLVIKSQTTQDPFPNLSSFPKSFLKSFHPFAPAISSCLDLHEIYWLPLLFSSHPLLELPFCLPTRALSHIALGTFLYTSSHCARLPPTLQLGPPQISWQTPPKKTVLPPKSKAAQPGLFQNNAKRFFDQILSATAWLLCIHPYPVYLCSVQPICFVHPLNEPQTDRLPHPTTAGISYRPVPSTRRFRLVMPPWTLSSN